MLSPSILLALSSCGLHLGPPAFGDGPYARELRAAHRAAIPAAEGLLQLQPSPTAAELEALRLELGVSLSASGSHREGGRWLTHVDQHCVTVSLLGPEGALLGLVWSLASRGCAAARDGREEGQAELLYATADGGAFVQRGSGAPEEARLGGASMRANVVHLSDAPCREVDLMARLLRDTGTGMPLEFTTASEASCGGCACDGLLHLFRAQCDVHLAPPRRFLERTPATQQQQAGRRSMSPYPPPPVLCAFGVLLDEAGGALRDVYGEPVDYNAAADAAFFDSTTSVLPLRGLLACQEAMLPYFARSTRAAFPFPRGEIDAVLDEMRLAGDWDAPRAVRAKLVGSDGWELGLGGVGGVM